MGAPRATIRGRRARADKAPGARKGARGPVPFQAKSASRLPKPPQGHGGFARRLGPYRPPRRDGLAPRYTNRNAKEQMLASALKAASERGYEAMRVADITEPVGVTRQAFYAHFRDKRHCMAEAIDPKLGVIERMAAALSESDAATAARVAHALDEAIAERFGSAEGTRGRILAAIGELLAEDRTLHEVTIGQIVKGAHVPQGDFYKQFSTKRECFAVHYEQLLEQLVAEVEEEGVISLPELLAALGERLAEDPQRLRVLVVESAHLPEVPEPGSAGAWRGSLTDAIADLIGRYVADVAESERRLFAASIVEVVRSALLSSEADALADRLASLSFDLASTPAPVERALAA